jgi:hypothetical protein
MSPPWMRAIQVTPSHVAADRPGRRRDAPERVAASRALHAAFHRPKCLPQERHTGELHHECSGQVKRPYHIFGTTPDARTSPLLNMRGTGWSFDKRAHLSPGVAHASPEGEGDAASRMMDVRS